ncbi:MAG: hypothetical protein PVI43_01720 [Candidatus Bathyarchaeota archaeon]|jgi:hypothetical protein
MTKQDFIELGGKEWIKGNIDRVYLNADIFNGIADTNFSDRKNKFFFDCNTNTLMRSYKGKKPTIEKKF